MNGQMLRGRTERERAIEIGDAGVAIAYVARSPDWRRAAHVGLLLEGATWQPPLPYRQ